MDIKARDLKYDLEIIRSSLAGNYRKGVNSLLEFIYSHPASYPTLTPELIENWIVDLMIRETSLKTAIHYLDIISALYPFDSSEKDNIDKTFFKQIKEKLKTKASSPPDSNILLKDLYAIMTLINSSKSGDEDEMILDLLRLSLCNCQMSVYHIAALKKNELYNLDEFSLHIAEKYISPNRKYIFPLHQSEITSRQLKRTVDQKIVKLFQLSGIKPMGEISGFIKSIQALAALKAGIPATTVVSLFPDSIESLSILSICSTTAVISEKQRLSLYQTINKVFSKNPEYWYALHMRKGIKFDHLAAKISTIKNLISPNHLFYPMKEITKKVKNRLVFKETPILPGIVFFKSRPIDVPEIFRNIGSMAWGYKNGDRYAAISDREIAVFKDSIGYFTPCTEIKPGGSIELQPDDNVIIIGGMLAGMEGRFKDHKNIKETDGGRIICRLLLPSDNGIEWIVDVDPRLVKKI